jgi:hypothetical protein
VNFILSTRGRVDASPEHLRPGFDGGTGVRTGRTNSHMLVRLYSHFGEERYPALRFVVLSEDDESNEGTG